MCWFLFVSVFLSSVSFCVFVCSWLLLKSIFGSNFPLFPFLYGIVSFLEVSLVSWCFSSKNVLKKKRNKILSYFLYFPFHSRSWWQPSNASHWRFRSYCHHPSKWNRAQAPEVSECKWNAGIRFPAQQGKCMLGPVYRVLWATPMCWNEESTWIHTGTGNKDKAKFTTYVFCCSVSFNFLGLFLTFLINVNFVNIISFQIVNTLT